MRKIYCALVAILIFSTAVESRSQEDDSPMKIVEALSGAFNRHDADPMAQYVAEDIKWFSLAADSFIVEVEGRASLREAMKSYFSSIPSARSEIEASVLSGSYVAIRERASWRSQSGEKSQVSLGVCEVRDNRVVGVWYYPAER